MIGPKVGKPTPADERDAYELATFRDLDTCQFCRRDCGPVARDHRQNRQPGNTIASNLQCLGLTHHIWKTEHPKDALAQGWSVPSWAEPHEWPARRWVRSSDGAMLRLSWVLYDDEGSWVEISDQEARERMAGILPELKGGGNGAH